MLCRQRSKAQPRRLRSHHENFRDQNQPRSVFRLRRSIRHSGTYKMLFLRRSIVAPIFLTARRDMSHTAHYDKFFEVVVKLLR